jgi:hypothetical protein
VIATRNLGFSSVFALFLLSSAGASVDAQPVLVGTVVEVRPDTRTLLLQVGVADGQPVLRRFRLADSVRVRVDGGFGRLADVVVGQSARILYSRGNGANIAESVDVTSAPPAGSSLSGFARSAAGIEDRRRYLEEVERNLDVLEGSVEELKRFPEVDGTRGLERREAVASDLAARITAARSLLSSLSPTAPQNVWAEGVDSMNAALADLSAAHQRGWSIIGNR